MFRRSGVFVLRCFLSETTAACLFRRLTDLASLSSLSSLPCLPCLYDVPTSLSVVSKCRSCLCWKPSLAQFYCCKCPSWILHQFFTSVKSTNFSEKFAAPKKCGKCLFLPWIIYWRNFQKDGRVVLELYFIMEYGKFGTAEGSHYVVLIGIFWFWFWFHFTDRCCQPLYYRYQLDSLIRSVRFCLNCPSEPTVSYSEIQKDMLLKKEDMKYLHPHHGVQKAGAKVTPGPFPRRGAEHRVLLKWGGMHVVEQEKQKRLEKREERKRKRSELDWNGKTHKTWIKVWRHINLSLFWKIPETLQLLSETPNNR